MDRKEGPGLGSFLFTLAAGAAAGAAMLYAFTSEESKAQPSTSQSHSSSNNSSPKKPSSEDDCCGICADNALEVVLLPCAHRFCLVCAKKVNECPICRSHIESRVKYF